MARYDKHGAALPTNLLEAAIWHFCVVATCRKCRSEGVFDPHALWWHFDRKGWDVGIHSLSHRLKCMRCGAGAFVSWSKDRTPTIVLPKPPEERWKQILNRLRS